MVSTFPERLRNALSSVPLRWVLVVPLVLPTVGVVGVVGYFSYQSGQAAVTDLAIQLLDTVDRRVRDRLNADLQFPPQTVAASSRLAQQGNLALADLEQVRRYLWLQINQSPFLDSSVFVNYQGQHIGYRRVQSQVMIDQVKKLTGEDLAIGTLLLAESREPQFGQRKYYLVDNQGKPKKLIYTLPGERQPTDWLSTVRMIQQPIWSPLPVMPMLGLYALAPAYDGTGRFQGTFAADYALSKISAYLSQLSISPRGQTFIVSRSGDLVATSTLETPLPEDLTGKGNRIAAVNSTNRQTRAIARQLVQQFGNWTGFRRPQHLKLVVDQQQQFVHIAPYQDHYGLDWLIVTVIPMADFMTEIEANKTRTIWLSWFTLLVTMGLGIPIARWLTKPLQQLNRSAQQIAQGQLEQTMPLAGGQEVDQRAASCQQMPTPLQTSFAALPASQQTLVTLVDSVPMEIVRENYQRELEQQVAYRTEELTQANELWEAIFNQSTDAIFLVEPYPSMRIWDCNQRTVELFDVTSKNELIGIQGTMLQKVPYTAAEVAAIKADLQRHRSWNRDIEYVTKSGRTFWGNLALKPIQVGGESLCLARMTDISDRKAIEFAWQQSQARMQNLAMTLPGTIYSYVLHPDGTSAFEYLNPAIEKLTELPLEACLADANYTLLGLMHPDDRPNYLSNLSHSARTLHPFTYEWRIITPSGLLKWLRAASQPERRSNGDICWHGLVLDVSEAKFADADRQQAEADLRESEERFRQIAATIDQLFFVRHARTGQFLYISPAYEKIWGRSCESLYNNPESWLEAIYPDDHEQVITSLRRQFEGNAVSREYRIQRPDGSIRWILAQVSPVLGEDGQPVRYAGFAVDITERKQAEEQLRENEATNRALLQAIPDLLIRMRRDGTYLDIRHGGTIKLFNPDTVQIGTHISQSMPEATVQERLFYTEEALRTGEVRVYEQQLLIDQQLYYEEVRIVPCAPDEVLIIVRDISSRKRTEAALRESEERFRRAFDDAAIGMSLVALDGRFLSANRALCEMVGYSEPELLQRTFQTITHPDDLDVDFRYIQQVLAGEIRSFQLEKRYIHIQGHIVWVSLNVSVVKDQNGIPLYFVAQIQDISDRHKIDRLKDEFISVVSHELRTPLTAIRGSLGILETGIFDDRPAQAKHMLQVALNNTDRLVRLVNDILDLERLESGKVHLMMQRCQVADLMQQAVDLVQPLAAQATIHLQMTPLVAEMTADPDAIVQTLTNLLSNAIKFSPAESTVCLTARICLPGYLPTHPRVHAAILFAVKDQGRGIPAEKIETIFGRFQQVDVSDARQKGGTGLGLAICESIIRQHNGQIWAESVLGQGSTFYFTVPLGEDGPS